MFDVDQLLTDGVMFWFTAFICLSMALITLWTFAHRDIDWVWSAAFDVPYAMIVLGYLNLWATPDTPTFLFPIVSALTRPGIVGVSTVVLFYSIYRLAQKQKLFR